MSHPRRGLHLERLEQRQLLSVNMPPSLTSHAEFAETLGAGTDAEEYAPPGGALSQTHGRGPQIMQEQEPNDHRKTANEFKLDAHGEIQIVGVLDGTQDQDYFTFRPGHDGILTFKLQATDRASMRVQIEGASDHRQLPSDLGHRSDQGVVKVRAGETYFVHVGGAVKTAVKYNLELGLRDPKRLLVNDPRASDTVATTADRPAVQGLSLRHSGPSADDVPQDPFVKPAWNSSSYASATELASQRLARQHTLVDAIFADDLSGT